MTLIEIANNVEDDASVIVWGFTFSTASLVRGLTAMTG